LPLQVCLSLLQGLPVTVKGLPSITEEQKRLGKDKYLDLLLVVLLMLLVLGDLLLAGADGL